MLQNINNDAQLSVTTAFEIGIPTPHISFRGQEKPGIRYEFLDSKILIECIDGPRCTFSWFGDKFRVITINDRALLSGGQGPHLDENCMSMFVGKFDKVEKYIGRLNRLISKNDPEYSGFVSLEVIFSKDDGRPFFRGLRLGATIDFLYCLCKLYHVEDDLDALIDTENTPSGVAVSARVYSYPYGAPDNLALDLPLSRGDESYIAVNHAERLKDAWKGLYSGLENINACYRIDGMESARRIYAELKRFNHI